MVKLKKRKINKLLVANRGEIAIRIFRACTELGIDTVAIYSKEDSGALHRYKADESYLVGEGKGPIEAYLDIEGIIELAKNVGADAIHPGYGFLSENIEFAKRCEEEGIIFVGPTSKHLEMFGDKVKAKTQAIEAGLPIIPGTDGPVSSLSEVRQFAEEAGYPIIIKASLGGGGRGMRIVHHEVLGGHASLLLDFHHLLVSQGSEVYAVVGTDGRDLQRLAEFFCSVQLQAQTFWHV
ncbi:MAG: hypothetical protein LOD92_07395, partial [Bacillales bacterium]